MDRLLFFIDFRCLKTRVVAVLSKRYFAQMKSKYVFGYCHLIEISLKSCCYLLFCSLWSSDSVKMTTTQTQALWLILLLLLRQEAATAVMLGLCDLIGRRIIRMRHRYIPSSLDVRISHLKCLPINILSDKRRINCCLHTIVHERFKNVCMQNRYLISHHI